MMELMIGPGSKKKIQQLSLSNDTIHQRIDDMVTVVCQQVFAYSSSVANKMIDHKYITTKSTFLIEGWGLRTIKG